LTLTGTGNPSNEQGAMFYAEEHWPTIRLRHAMRRMKSVRPRAMRIRLQCVHDGSFRLGASCWFQDAAKRGRHSGAGISPSNAARRRSIAAMTWRENGPRCRQNTKSATTIRTDAGLFFAQFLKVCQNTSRASGISATTQWMEFGKAPKCICDEARIQHEHIIGTWLAHLPSGRPAVITLAHITLGFQAPVERSGRSGP
jgi:hypothetical protein